MPLEGTDDRGWEKTMNQVPESDGRIHIVIPPSVRSSQTAQNTRRSDQYSDSSIGQVESDCSEHSTVGSI